MSVYEELLRRGGFDHIVVSFDLDPHRRYRTDPRHNGLLIASRCLLRPLPPLTFRIPDLVPMPRELIEHPQACMPARDCVLSALIERPEGLIELHNAHMPHGIGPDAPTKLKKVVAFDALVARLMSPSAYRRILCGDLNSPWEETADGRVLMCYERLRGDGRVAVEGGRWEVENRHVAWAERAVILGLLRSGFVDAFRAHHAYSEPGAFSWLQRGVRNGTAWEIRRRLDHVYASPQLNPTECHYLYDVLDRKLSDHCPIEALFRPFPEGATVSRSQPPLPE